MKFIELMQNRYTTKSYDENKSIKKKTLNELKNVLHLCPSSINSQPWKFYFVENEKLKTELANVSYFNKQRILNANCLVVFNAINDVTYFEKKMKDYLPEGAIGYYNNFIKSKKDVEIKAWIQHQVYLSLGFFLSACANLGIDSTAMEGIENEKYATILNLNKYYPVFAVAIGFRNNEDSNQPKNKPKSRLPFNEIIDYFSNLSSI